MLPEMISGPVVETDAQIQCLRLSAETERGPTLGVVAAGEEHCRVQPGVRPPGLMGVPLIDGTFPPAFILMRLY